MKNTQQGEQDFHYVEDNYIIYNCCRGGMVEAVEVVGNTTKSNSPIMFTAGGYDGRIRFWNWDTFSSLGSLRVHPGQMGLTAEAALASGASSGTPRRWNCSPVVSCFFCHERCSLISLCRDGNIYEWAVEKHAKKWMVDEAAVAAANGNIRVNRKTDCNATNGNNDPVGVLRDRRKRRRWYK